MDTEDPSGYTITDADRRFAKDLGFVAPEVLPLHVARFRTRVLEDDRKQRQPASPPDRLPVPGAAVREVIDQMRNNNRPENRFGVDWYADRLEAALRADAAEMPSREEVADALRLAWYKGRAGERDTWDDLTPGHKEMCLNAADKAIELLARRPGTDEAEALRKQLDDMEEGNESLLNDCGAYVARIADLESQLASVTAERDCGRDRMRVTAERLEAADRHIESLDSDYASEHDRRIKAERERDEALLQAERAQVSAKAAIDDARKACAARDEALAKLAERDKVILILEGQRDTFRDAHKNAAADCELRAREYAELAAANAGAHRSLDIAGIANGPLEARVQWLTGDRASVSVPQGGQLQIEHEAMRKRWGEATDERDQLRADLEKARAELEACKRELFAAKAYGDQMCKARDRVQAQHEALRDGVEYGCEALERHDGPENKTTSWYAERFRALLKSAPAEAEPQLIDQLIDQNSPAFLRSKLEATEEIAAGLRAELREVRSHAELLQGTLNETRGERDRAESELEKTRADRAVLETALNRENAHRTEIAGDLASARAELEKTRASLEATQGELEDALGDRDLQSLGEELAGCKRRLEGYERSNRELRDKWNAELREVARLHGELEKSGIDARAYKAELDALRTHHGCVEHELEKARAELAQMTAFRDQSLKDYEALDKVFREHAYTVIAVDKLLGISPLADPVPALRGYIQQFEKTRAELEASRQTIHEIANALGYVDWSDGGRFIQASDERIIEAAHEAAGWQSSYEMYPELFEQHEALRDGVDTVTSEMEDDGNPAIGDDTWTRGYENACRSYSRRLRALLKPAPAEAEQSIDEWAAQKSTPVQHQPPESAMVEPAPCPFCGPNFLGTCPHRPSMGVEAPVPASLQPLTARLERLVRDNGLLWRFVAHVAQPNGIAWHQAAQEALDARKETP